MGGMEFVAPTLLLIGGVALLFSIGFSFLPTIAYYRYAMSDYILAENPELSPSEAIARSKDLMDGYKWDLFVLDLTFIGWILLSILTLGIGVLFVEPYQQAARSAFYEDLRAQRIVEEH